MPIASPAEFQEDLLLWFAVARRDMPWRNTRDPYGIWVSEVMLQQTQVDTVRDYWIRFMERFPTVESLATAHLDAVLKAWEGLGYYSRARNLHKAARALVERHGGVLPADPAALRALPGFGPYTAGAVAAIAFGLPEPAVDGNVLRVLSRLADCHEDVTLPATRKRFEDLARQLTPPGRASAFAQALMELGALICTPRKPRCGDCPVARACRARRAGTAEALPRKATRRKAPHADVAVAVCLSGSRVLVTRRPERGMLGGLMAFPQVQVAEGEPLEAAIGRALQLVGVQGVCERSLVSYPFVFSHLRTIHHAHVARWSSGEPESPARWAEVSELPDLAFPKALAPVRSAVLALAFEAVPGNARAGQQVTTSR